MSIEEITMQTNNKQIWKTTTDQKTSSWNRNQFVGKLKSETKVLLVLD